MRAQLPIKDKMLATFTAYMLLKTNSVPRSRPVWDGKPVGDHKWAAWKEFFKPLQLALKRKTAAASDAPDIFRNAAVAQRLQGIIPGIPANGGETPGLMELLYSQFNALATASSTRNTALDHLSVATPKQYV